MLTRGRVLKLTKGISREFEGKSSLLYSPDDVTKGLKLKKFLGIEDTVCFAIINPIRSSSVAMTEFI